MTMETIEDRVNHPRHYAWLQDVCGIEPIDICREMDFDLGNAVKYLLRAGRKGEQGYSSQQKKREDLKKAIYYIQDAINYMEEESHCSV